MLYRSGGSWSPSPSPSSAKAARASGAPEQAAVDRDVGSGDVVRSAASEKGGDAGEVVRRADAVRGNSPHRAPHELGVALQALGHRRVDQTWQDGVDLDVVGGPRSRTVLAELHDARLGRSVGGPARTADV